MKKWIVRNTVLSYDSKVFGNTFRHLRVVNIAMPFFVLAGLFNLFTEGFDLLDALVFLPFLLVFFSSKWVNWEYGDLDWEQRHQLQEKQGAGPAIRSKWRQKYKGPENFVEAWRFFSPIVWIIAGLLIYWIFGTTETGFHEKRFF